LIAANGQTVFKMLNEGRLFKIGNAIESDDPLRAGEEASKLLADTLAVAANLVTDGALGPEFGVLRQLVSGVNGDSCITNKAGEFTQWTAGLITSLLTKDAESIKKIWSFIVDSPADIFVSDSAGNLTSVMGIGAVAEGIPSSQGLLLKTDPVIKIVNILEAGDQYNITLRGTGEGGTGLTIFQPKSDGGLVQIKYTNIPTTASSEATIMLDRNIRNYILMLDIDGNGTVDQQISPDNIGIVINATPTANQIISALYTATFNRAPDKAGLTFWESQFSVNSTDAVKQLAAGFASHPVFTEQYGTLSNQAFVEAIYNNVLGGPGDITGVLFWINTLDTGTSRSDFLATFVQSALSTDLNAALQAGDLTQSEYDAAVIRQNFLTNKANVGLYFTNTLGVDTNLLPTTDASTIAGLNADPAYRASIKILKGVDNTAASVVTAQSLVNQADASTDSIQFINDSALSGL